MPSHPDRVRRNYHKITVENHKEDRTNDSVINIRISKVQIATLMSKYEVRREIWRMISEGLESYG